MDWDLVSFVISGKLRFRILIELNKVKKTPSNLSRITKSPVSHVSSTIKELEVKGLIKCLTPERRKNKFYEATELGKELLDFISKETKRISISQEL
ncbi:MAG: hypothetical protein QXF35_01605 [Candidatus Bilamarchaeaceae archaeon]